MKKIFVITGSTSGIGNALLKKIVKDNIVFAGYRNEKYVEELENLGAIPFYIDMEKPSSISKASAFIKSQTDRVDVMINIAGCVVAGVMESLPICDIRKQFEVNTFSHLDFTQRLLPLLRDKVINISSMASFGMFPFIAPYCASKRALDILFNGLTLESRIKVVSVKPGVIATPLWDKSVEINRNAIKNCGNHEKEMKFLVDNAHKNGKNGLKTEKVVNLILKIIDNNNPKPSYTVGIDAKLAEMFSKLPFSLQNKLIKAGITMRIK